MMKDTKEFYNFPVVGPEFDIVRIDVMKFEEEGKVLYNPMIIFLATDGSKLNNGVTLITNSYYDDIESVGEFIFMLIKTRMFFGEVNSGATLYDEAMNRVGEIDWNKIIGKIIDDNFHDKFEISTNTDPDRVLH